MRYFSIPKNQLLSILLFVLSLPALAQVGIGTTTPDPSAQLDVVSTSKGVLVPRVTSTTLVTATAEGLLVYQTSAPTGFYVYKSGSWVRLATVTDVAATVIPYASGTQITLSTLSDGSSAGSSAISFGNSLLLTTTTPSTITGSEAASMAFSMPRDGTITALAAALSIQSVLFSANPITVMAYLYRSDTTSDVFNQIASVALTTLPVGTVSIGTVIKGFTSLNIPITAQTRLLLLFSSSTQSGATTLKGFANAGLSIK
ncbi:exosporium glycoprotein BclB-related protein [Spirosoma gilvum]